MNPVSQYHLALPAHPNHQTKEPDEDDDKDNGCFTHPCLVVSRLMMRQYQRFQNGHGGRLPAEYIVEHSAYRRSMLPNAPWRGLR